MMPSAGSAGVRKYVVMGPQGSGKGSQAKRLKDAFDLVHISVGDILRWNVQSHTRLGARIRPYLEAGVLVPDEVVEEIMRERLHRDWSHGFVLDGFPRSERQALFFESYDIDAVIAIAVPDDVATERMLSRRLCSRCGLDYNLIQNRPAVAGVCDVCGGALVTRTDDTPQAIRTRLAEYNSTTRPILEMFRRKELIVAVDGTRTPDEVQRAIRQRLGLGDGAGGRDSKRASSGVGAVPEA